MIRKSTLLLLMCLGLHFVAKAQLCGFDQKHQQLMNTDPAYANAVNQFKVNWNALQNTSALITTLPNGDTVYEIPVVIHVIHTGGPLGSIYNPLDATLINMIDYLNQSFAATWPAYPDTMSGGTRVPIKFVLAQRDPNCAATTGINRVDGSGLAGYLTDGMDHGTSGAPELQVKALSRWPNTQYYNIWVVNMLDGNDGTSGSFTAGFAYFPGAPADRDGTVILATQAQAGRKTLPHEMGHAFDLYHTFQGASPCPPLAPCATTGDEVCDTEPHSQSPVGTCPNPTGTNPCTGNSRNHVTENFMDYSNCPLLRFTPGQRERMMLALTTQRASLITSLGGTPPPTSPLPVACTPGILNPTNNSNCGPRRIILSDLNVTSSGYNGDGNLVYIDNTCKYMATLIAGTTYPVTVQTHPFTTERIRVYIDYNNNGIFEPAAIPSELIFSDFGGTGNHNFNYSVPTTGPVNCTPLRMRIMSDRTIANTFGPCGDINNQLGYGQAEDYMVIIKGSSTPVTGAVTISLTDGGNPSCHGMTLEFTAVPGSGITNPTYKWFNNGVPITGVTTNPVLSSNVFLNNDVVTARIYFMGLCGPDSALSNAVTVFRVTTVTPAITNTLTRGTLPACIDDTLVFSATNPINPGGGPDYEWFVNGISQAPASPANTTLTLVNQAPGTTVYVVMTSKAPTPCALPPKTATSNTITITHVTRVPTVNIALTGGTNPGCPGQLLTFTATHTTGGTSPTFIWRVNGNVVQTSASTVFSSQLNNGDMVSCDMLSSSACAVPSFANSNAINIVHTQITADVNIVQTAGTNPLCSSKPAEFTAFPINAGTNPQFQWLINNSPVPGANSIIFTSTNLLANNDIVSCVLIATDPCVANPLDTSNGIIMLVVPADTPYLTVDITKGNNPGCLDSLLEFTATARNIGTNPNYTWLLNGFPVANGPVFSSSTLLNGTVVTCRVNQTDNGCYSKDTIESAPIPLTLSPTPAPPIIHLIGNMLVASLPGTYIWYGPAGEQIMGETNQTYHPGELGAYFARFNNNGCLSQPSNTLTITLLDVSTANIDDVKIYPNPTNGKVVLDWGKTTVNMKVDVYSAVGQVLIKEEVKDKARKTIDLGALANGVYFIVLTDQAGKSGTVRITLTK